MKELGHITFEEDYDFDSLAKILENENIRIYRLCFRGHVGNFNIMDILDLQKHCVDFEVQSSKFLVCKFENKEKADAFKSRHIKEITFKEYIESRPKHLMVVRKSSSASRSYLLDTIVLRCHT